MYSGFWIWFAGMPGTMIDVSGGGLRPLPGRLVTDSRSALGARRARPHATPFAQQHLKFHGPQNSGRSVAEWAPSLKKATDACVLASNNASPAQRGPRRNAQPLHATPLAAVLFPARSVLGISVFYFFVEMASRIL